MKRLERIFLAFGFLLMCGTGLSTHAFADDSPSGSINSFKISLAVAKHYLSYLHWRPIGLCVWLHHGWLGAPYITMTPELTHYLPDMVVSVYNEPGDNPWTEANKSFDKAAQSSGNQLIEEATGDELTNGHNTSIHGEDHNDSVITKSADVIGAPMNLMHFPFFILRPDTKAFMPYYQSGLDSVPGRMGFAEDLEPYTWSPVGHYVGSSFVNHWAYEFPRDMSVDNNNDYKASVVIGLHAADIVTNNNTLHVVHSTEDSCGDGCAVANVLEEQNDDHEIWEEVYPNDRHIHPGESDLRSVKPIGHEDEKEGHGNYVFVLWRHYKGCVQSPGGKLLYQTVHVSPTQKR